MNLKQRFQRAEAINSMVEDLDTTHPPDICLILRAHGEQRWLVTKVVPIVRQLEHPSLVPEDQVGAALAYLEVLWLDARNRAAETDAAHAELDRRDSDGDRILFEKARRYYAAVRRLRSAVGRRVNALTGAPTGAPCQARTLADR